MSRRRPRTDVNHKEIVSALRKAGALVQSLAGVGSGCPDILCFASGRLVLLELKAGKGKVTDDQIAFLKAGWPVFVVRDAESAIAIVRGE